MGKLGKKARKFAKKNLQSVLRQRRKTKAVFRKRSAKKNDHISVEDQTDNTPELYNIRKDGGHDVEDISLQSIFSEDESDVVEDASDSDEFLSEVADFPGTSESESDRIFEDDSISELSVKNRKISEELSMLKNKLDRLKKKDPKFVAFLRSYMKDAEISGNEVMYYDEDEASDQELQVDEDGSGMAHGKVLTNSIVNTWCQLVTEDHNESALISLLNGYRTACQYGVIGPTDAAACYRIQNSEAYRSILMFMLREADSLFRGLLKMSSTNCKKETILDLQNSSKWKDLKPLLKSYLRSTLFLLNQVSDSEILAFSLDRLRSSIIFFAAFPPLLHRLIKAAIHLWATGGGALSCSSFLIIRDVALMFKSQYFDKCLVKAYKAYIAHCNVLELSNVKHIQFLRNSVVELCSLGVQTSSSKAVVSIQQLSKILQQGLRTRKKEAIKKVCSWQYACCIELWVMFISRNIHDYDLQSLLYATIHLISGVVHLFPGPRYFPLRIKCIRWLNDLSKSSGIFIPMASILLDGLEYKIGKEGGKDGKAFHFESVLKLPKQSLKSQLFLEECVFAVIELLAVHFTQWSYHISFPDLATIPLIRLKKFLDTTKIEGLRRVVRRLIDQVEQNVDFVQKKRDEIAFSPKDHQSVESFLQLEKNSLNSSFIQCYKSLVQKAVDRRLQTGDKSSFGKKRLKRMRGQIPQKMVDTGAASNSEKHSLSDRGGSTEPRAKKHRFLKS